ncbi:MAG: DUF2905 domain-containing protein [Oleiphilaceae bacterium]|nr:DUF2905 domain-containing protein [Oleiphilaceae bacterium]
MSRILILSGLLLLAAGLLWPWLTKLPLGHLPGDIVIHRENSTLYFPVTSMILISLLISLLLNQFNR